MKFLLITSTLTALLVVSCNDKKQPAQTKQEKADTEEFLRAAEALQDEHARSLEETGNINSDPEKLQRAVDAAKKMETNATGKQAKLSKALRIWMEMMQRDTLNLQNQVALINESIEYGKLTKPEDLDTYSAKIHQYLKNNTELTEQIKHGWLTDIKAKTKEAGLTEDDIKEFLEGITFGFGKIRPQLLIIRKTDEDLCKAVLEQHTILKQQWGKWQWDSKQGVPVFQDNDTLEAYNKSAQKIQKASAQQGEAQRKLIQIQRSLR